MSTTTERTDAQRREEPATSLRVSDRQHDASVLTMLIYDSSCALWSVEEVMRMHGNRTDAADSLNRLVAAGLLHRIGEFVFPTLAARRCEELER